MRYNTRRGAFWLSVITLLILGFWTAERATVVAAPDPRSTIYIIHHKRKTHRPEEIIEIHRNPKRKHKLNIVLVDSWMDLERSDRSAGWSCRRRVVGRSPMQRLDSILDLRLQRPFKATQKHGRTCVLRMKPKDWGNDDRTMVAVILR